MNETSSPDFFESMYKRDRDPWNFSSSEYEQGRYETIISALDDTHYKRAFEPGCSIGIMTAKLAPLCEKLFAIDMSHTAILNAQQYCLSASNVDLRVGRLPQDIPEGSFDLIVFSEIGYYFEEPDLLTVGSLLVKRLEHGGVLLAAHWLGHSDDHILSGERVHEIMDRLDGLVLKQSERFKGFHLSKWVRV